MRNIYFEKNQGIYKFLFKASLKSDCAIIENVTCIYWNKTMKKRVQFHFLPKLHVTFIESKTK